MKYALVKRIPSQSAKTIISSIESLNEVTSGFIKNTTEYQTVENAINSILSFQELLLSFDRHWDAAIAESDVPLHSVAQQNNRVSSFDDLIDEFLTYLPDNLLLHYRRHNSNSITSSSDENTLTSTGTNVVTNVINIEEGTVQAKEEVSGSTLSTKEVQMDVVVDIDSSGSPDKVDDGKTIVSSVDNGNLNNLSGNKHSRESFDTVSVDTGKTNREYSLQRNKKFWDDDRVSGILAAGNTWALKEKNNLRALLDELKKAEGYQKLQLEGATEKIHAYEHCFTIMRQVQDTSSLLYNKPCCDQYVVDCSV